MPCSCGIGETGSCKGGISWRNGRLGAEGKSICHQRALTTGSLLRSEKGISLGRSQRTRCRCLPIMVTITSLLSICLRSVRNRYRHSSDTCSMLRQGGRSPQSRQCSFPRRGREISESGLEQGRKPSTDEQGLYPEGIDVLGKTDFFSVSVRRVAFTTAAPAVAV